MTSVMIVAVMLFGLLGSSKSFSVFNENLLCSKRESPMENFDFDKYMGTWYEYQRFDNPFERDGAKCVEEKLNKTAEGKARVTQTMRLSSNNETVSVKATLSKVSNDSSNGDLRIQYDRQEVGSDYVVLYTDYDSYAVVWSCKRSPWFMWYKNILTEYAWVLTRDRRISDKTENAIFKYLLENTWLNLRELLYTDQSCSDKS